MPRVNVSVKLSALDSQFDPIDPRGTTARVAVAAAAAAASRACGIVRMFTSTWNRISIRT